MYVCMYICMYLYEYAHNEYVYICMYVCMYVGVPGRVLVVDQEEVLVLAG